MPFSSVLADRSNARIYSFGDAVLAGWADDGGMLWPTQVPKLNRGILTSWAKLSYSQLCAELLKLFVPDNDVDISHADIEALVSSAFDAFGSDKVVETKPLPSSRSSPIHVAELWHGPTLAFKDLGMSVLGKTLNHLLTRRTRRLTLLVGTSGDTGSSAIEAVRGLRNIDIVVLYPLQAFSASACTRFPCSMPAQHPEKLPPTSCRLLRATNLLPIASISRQSPRCRRGR